MTAHEILSESNAVVRDADTVLRPRASCSEDRLALARYMEERGLPVEHVRGLSATNEIYSYAIGEMVHPQRWTDAALYEIGGLVRSLHDAAREFTPPHGLYKPWCLREIGASTGRIWCHGDIAPWNMLTRAGRPLCLVDWEYAGPLAPMVELARVCWLFPQLVDDDLGRLYELPAPEWRARQVRLICDGYGLDAAERAGMTQQIIEVIVCETAHEAIDPGLTFESTGSLWGFAWRTRSLYWTWRNRGLLERALL